MASREPDLEEERAAAKTKLERRKLELEIRQLRRRWWQNPSYVLAALPTVLALGTLSIGFATGYFQNERTLIDLRNENLRAEERKLKQDVGALEQSKARTSSEIEGLRTSKATLEGQVASLDREKTQMSATTRRLGLEVDEQKAKIDRLDIAIRTYTVNELIKGLRTAASYEFEGIAYRLGEAVRHPGQDSSRSIALMVSELQSAKDDGRRAVLLTGLYIGCGDAHWMDELIRLGWTRGERPEFDDAERGLWGVFTYGKYSRDDCFKILRMVHHDLRAAIPNERKWELLWIIYCLHAHSGSGYFLSKKLDYYVAHPDDFLLAVRTARDQMLLPGMNEPVLKGSAALREIAPEAFIVTCAVYLADDGRTNSATRVGLLQDLSYTNTARYPDLPQTTGAWPWRLWTLNHRDIVTQWTEPDLGSLARDSAKLASILATGFASR